MSDISEFLRLERECEELAEPRAEYQVIRVLIAFAADRDPLLARLRQLVTDVSHGEWTGYSGALVADQVGEPLSEAAVFLATDIERILEDYPTAGRSSATRAHRAMVRYQWAAARVSRDAAPLVDLEAKALQARARLPHELDSAISGFDRLTERLRTRAGGETKLVVSLHEVLYAMLLARRGTPDDFKRAEVILHDAYQWRAKVFGEDHLFTLVAVGHRIQTVLRKAEGTLPFASPQYRSSLLKAMKDANQLCERRKKVLGEHSRTVSLSLGYLARIALALGETKEAIGYSLLSIAAMPDPHPSMDLLTVPMSEVVLAQAYMIEVGRGTKGYGDKAATARQLVERAKPALSRSAESQRWVDRAESLHLLSGSARELTNR